MPDAVCGHVPLHPASAHGRGSTIMGENEAQHQEKQRPARGLRRREGEKEKKNTLFES